MSDAPFFKSFFRFFSPFFATGRLFRFTHRQGTVAPVWECCETAQHDYPAIRSVSIHAPARGATRFRFPDPENRSNRHRKPRRRVMTPIMRRHCAGSRTVGKKRRYACPAVPASILMRPVSKTYRLRCRTTLHGGLDPCRTRRKDVSGRLYRSICELFRVSPDYTRRCPVVPDLLPF